MSNKRISRMGKHKAVGYLTASELRECCELNNNSARDTLQSVIVSNTLCNLAQIQRSPGILNFHNQFVGRPAFVIGLGPSLSTEQIEMLKAKRDEVIIIAIDAALPLLWDKGLIPHFVALLDPSERPAKSFDPPIDTTKFYTVASLVAHPETIRKIDPRHLIFYNTWNPENVFLREVIHHTGQKRGIFPACALTPGAAFEFAICMGCDPITFLGVDLSFPSPTETYAQGTPQWKVDFQSKIKFRGGLLLFPDIHGDLVLTHFTFMAFWQYVYDRTNEINRTFINATGAGILDNDNISQMDLAKVLDKYAKGPIPDLETNITRLYRGETLNGTHTPSDRNRGTQQPRTKNGHTRTRRKHHPRDSRSLVAK